MSCAGGGGAITSVSRRSYGAFHDNTEQTASSITASYSMKFNNTDLSDGITIVSGSRITFANVGVYDLQFSAQLNKASGNPANIDIWLAYTGSNVPNTNGRVEVDGSQAKSIAAWDYMFYVSNPNDYVELKWHVENIDITLHQIGTSSNPARPAVPSVIVTVMQI